MPRYALAKMTQKKYSYTNCVYMHPNDMQALGVSRNDHICIDEILVHRVKDDVALKEGTIGTNSLQWSALHLTVKSAIGKLVLVERWKEAKHNSGHTANTLTIVVDTYAKAETKIEVSELEEYIYRHFTSEILCKDQRWIVQWKTATREYWISLRVANIYVPKDSGSDEKERKSPDGDSGGAAAAASKKKRSRLANLRTARFAALKESTTISIMAASNPFLNLTQASGGPMSGIPDWDAERMGIGGLDSQFGVIFRRAFASRLYPPDLVKSLGVKHVKGMLLYGPPGTGKTLIARNIGYMLTEKEPKVVNGPEILNKFVGQSEENIRKLFEDAKQDQEKNGDKAGLHIIIFDEIDAICKQRGSTNTGTGVHDTVVNQLLSMVDGVNALNNILVIGMTNRKDLIDEALLRSGRLEVHIEIGLPDEQGREQIFRIHTQQIRENGYLADDISLADYAKRTKNYTGAEIEGVVRSAVSFAMQMHIDTDNLKAMDWKKMRDIKITKEFFEMALDEVKAEFGGKEDDLELIIARGIIPFNEKVTEIQRLTTRIVEKLRTSTVMNRQALLLQGEMGTGKSAMATHLALAAQFPFVRVLSAEDFVGASDSTISTKIAKVFNDAYKSQFSVVVIDDFERLIGYTIGPRFSNACLQALLTSIRRAPKDPARKILILVTATSDVVRTLEIDRVFDWVRDLPLITTRTEVERVMKQVNVDSGTDFQPSVEECAGVFDEEQGHSIGIADLLTVIELSATASGIVTKESFEEAIQSKMRGSRKKGKGVAYFS